ncbi:MAG: hypothetical protein NTV81_04520 [Candidatus Komeilibacteria bacterium]|nr:hypothetical protein [Candidatus Komeilibacteria bacterium]
MSWFRLELSQRRFFWLVVGGLLVVIFASHLAGFLQNSAQAVYSGARYFRVGDLFGYFSFMEQARQGAWSFFNLYSILPQQPYFIHPLWLVLGKLGAWTGFSNLVIYLLAQAALIVIFLFGWWNFIGSLVEQQKLRRFLFIFSLISGGLAPTWLHEVSTFLILYVNPLFVLALICFLAIIWSSFLTMVSGFSWKISLWGGTAGLFLMLNHFYDLIGLIFILIAFLVWLMIVNGRWGDYLKHLLVVGGLIMPGVIYYGYIFTAIPALAAWAKDNVTLSPGPWFYLKSYGLLLPLGLAGIWWLLRQKKWLIDRVKGQWLIIWLVVQLALLYSPILFNRRFALGASLPLTLLAGLVFWQLLQVQWAPNLKKLMIVAIGCGLLAGNAIMIIFDFIPLNHFFSPNQIQALRWLRDNSQPKSLILANMVSWDTIISGVTGRFSFVAGGYATSSGEQDWRFKFIRYFYQSNQDLPEKLKLLKSFGVNYVWFGPVEKKLGTFDPNQAPWLKLVFQSGVEKIYQIEK